MVDRFISILRYRSYSPEYETFLNVLYIICEDLNNWMNIHLFGVKCRGGWTLHGKWLSASENIDKSSLYSCKCLQKIMRYQHINSVSIFMSVINLYWMLWLTAIANPPLDFCFSLLLQDNASIELQSSLT